MDFIMHEYIHKYFETIKRTRKKFIRNIKPLGIREASRPGVGGGDPGSFQRLCNITGPSVLSAA